MNNINDIVNKSYNPMTMNREIKYSLTTETRTHLENESLAERLAEKLSAGENSRKFYLAVAYSGIPGSVLERHVATALETGRMPVRLFSFLVCKEPLWTKYKTKINNQENINSL
jgi:regulator of replication initiation timing